jgi:hypothetical protein
MRAVERRGTKKEMSFRFKTMPVAAARPTSHPDCGPLAEWAGVPDACVAGDGSDEARKGDPRY